jgi:hypothetical protein
MKNSMKTLKMIKTTRRPQSYQKKSRIPINQLQTPNSQLSAVSDHIVLPNCFAFIFISNAIIAAVFLHLFQLGLLVDLTGCLLSFTRSKSSGN